MKTLCRYFHDSFFRENDLSRNLFLLSLLVVILLPAYNMIYVYPSLTRLFTGTLTKDATNIATHFMSLFEPRITELTQKSLDVEALKETETLRKSFGLAKLKIFSPSGEILFSTDSREIGNINNERYFRDIVARGKVHTTVVRKNSDSLEHERMSSDVVEAYVPMMKDGAFLGAFEIYYDITQNNRRLKRLLSGSFAIVIVLALSVLALSAFSLVKEKRRATERKRAQEEREQIIGRLQNALAEVRRLSGLLPICSSCKKIRDDQGYWKQLEAYISEHSEAEFTHGICPECMKDLYGISLDPDSNAP